MALAPKTIEFIVKNFQNDPVGYFKHVLRIEPDFWQSQVLESVRDNRRTAVRSGHGVGKTLLSAGIIHWFIATRPYPQIVCTANTQTQLKTKLWRELSKVNTRALNKELFEWTATQFFLKDSPSNWFAAAIPWSEQNPEAFAGTHEEHVLMVFDEASAIPPPIWDTASGAMSTPGARWLVLGNPTRNTGKFFECFHKNSWQPGDTEDMGRWHGYTISCIDSPRVERSYIEEQKREYGEGSDFYRVRVLGLPPIQEASQFISGDLFDDAVLREIGQNKSLPRILGVDVARFGDDKTALVEKWGLTMKVVAVRRGQDTMATVGDIVDILRRAIQEEKRAYDYVVVDDIGVGGGVTDRLRELGVRVLPCNVGTTAHHPERYRRLRDELWDRYRQWIAQGKVSPELKEDTCSVLCSFDSTGKLCIEKKSDLKKRGLNSPDLADAACLTFAAPQGNLDKLKRKNFLGRFSRERNSEDSWAVVAGVLH